MSLDSINRIIEFMRNNKIYAIEIEDHENNKEWTIISVSPSNISIKVKERSGDMFVFRVISFSDIDEVNELSDILDKKSRVLEYAIENCNISCIVDINDKTYTFNGVYNEFIIFNKRRVILYLGYYNTRHKYIFISKDLTIDDINKALSIVMVS